MIHLTQFLTFEISRDCNYKDIHDTCPVKLLPRTDRVITDEMIIDAARSAYFELGFEGYISWSFYSEPLCEWQRVLRLTEAIKNIIPQSRFILWTNGSIAVYDDRMKLFDITYVSNYEKKTFEQLYRQGYYNVRSKMEGQALDDRMNHYGEPNNSPCTIMFSDFLISNSGEVYICCHDWMNEVKIGNLFDMSIKELDAKRWEYAKQISGKQMTDKAHDVCIRCRFKWPLHDFDLNIRNKALQEIAKMPS